MKRLLFIFLLTLLSSILTLCTASSVTDLRVSGLSAPLGIDWTPSFSWRILSDERGWKQSAYEILVKNADTGETVWQSGKIVSSQQSGIEYAGSSLQSRTRYTWTVTVWDTNDAPLQSVSSSFETAFLNADEWTSQWIRTSSTNVPMLQRTFSLDESKQVKRARIYASALGIFTMQLNGQSVTDNRLEPGETEYAKSLLYCTYDVTSLLRAGQTNTWTAELAGGIFNVTSLAGRYTKPEIKNSGDCSLRAELWVDYTDGTSQTFLTDDQWLWTPSATTGSNWWGGEDYDATLAVSASSLWQPVETVSSPQCTVLGVTAPVGTLKARRYAPVGVVESWEAQRVTPLSDGSYMVDFGRNFAGTYTFSLKGTEGQTIQLREFESLNADGTGHQYYYYSSNSVTYDQYTFAGTGSTEEWGPRFMYHGFRYLQVSGLTEAPQPSQFKAFRLRSQVESTGTFTTSNQLLNDIHTLCHDAIGSQLYNSITDCPQREKLGWLDVPNEMFNSLCYNFDMQAFFEKVVQDCFDAQKTNGCVNSTVPHYMQVYDDDPNWGGAAILVPYRCWQTYGDETLMRRYYTQMKKLMNYYYSLTTNGLMPGSSYSVLSDWGQSSAGLAHQTPTEFTITCTYYHLLCCMSEMASYLGYKTDVSVFRSRARSTRIAFNKAFYGNLTEGIYNYGNQAELGMALYYGLVPPENEQAVAKALADKVAADDYRIRTGEIGLKPVLMSLAKYGYNDVVYRMANQKDYPSYGYWVMQGCTTTPEYWDMTRSDNSQNHCMMDHIEEWFFGHLAGLRAASKGFASLDIAPWIPADMTSLQASTQTIAGEVSIQWQQDNAQKYTFRIEVPANATATIRLPLLGGNCVMENDTPILAGENGIDSIAYTADSATVVVGSGTYLLSTGLSCVDIRIP